MRANLIKHVFFISIILTISQDLFSQELVYIEGSILDSKTSEPLPYANIQVLNTNWGTTSNIDGKFSIVFEQTTPFLKFTYIGYKSRSVKFENSKRNITIELMPITLQGKEVIVIADRYSWIEKFILKAIERKNNFIEKLSHYQAYAYSKTSITGLKPKNKIYVLAESVSKIGYVSPDFYQEKMLNYKLPKTLQNLPNEVFRINQKINFHNDEIKIHNLSIISPLISDPFRFYDFELIEQNLMDRDTVITVGVYPKTNSKSLFQGNIVFNKNTYRLIEVNLAGNSIVSNGIFDSLTVCQKYAIKDSLYNLPVFTKYELRMNTLGLPLNYTQESHYINYVINNSDNKPNAFLDNAFILEPDLTYNVGLQRNIKFQVPLSEKEKSYMEMHESIPTGITVIQSLLYLPLDYPASIGNVKINKFSNWYHFSKVEGHFAGIEYQFFNSDKFSLYTHAGYAFSSRSWNYKINARYKQFFVGLQRDVVNLGNFSYNKSLQTIKALFTHTDDFNYYSSHKYFSTYTCNINSKINIISKFGIEQQTPIQNNSNWSFKKKDKVYPDNYKIQKYNRNYVGMALNYIENHDYKHGKTVIYDGDPFLNISLDYTICDKKTLKSTENRSILDINIHRFQPIYNPVSCNLQFWLHLQNNTKYIQEYNYINKEQALVMYDNSLSFFSLNHYEYIIQDLIRIKSDFTLLKMPKIYYFQLSIGGLVSYLRPLNQLETQHFNPLNDDFFEYGFSIKGISFFDFYLLKNNVNADKFYFGLKMSF